MTAIDMIHIEEASIRGPLQDGLRKERKICFSFGKIAFLKSILVIGLFLSIVLVYENKFGDVPYVVLLVTMVLIGGGLLIKFVHGSQIGFGYNFSIDGFSPFDKFLTSCLLYLWPSIVFSWVIGVSIGLLHGVNPELAFRNFFGLVVYMLFPVLLIVMPSRRSLITMLYFSGITQMCYALYSSYGLMVNTAPFVVESSIGELRLFASMGNIVVFPLLTVGLAYQLLPKRFLSNNYGSFVAKMTGSPIFTLWCLVALVVPAFSKGFILTMVILFLCVLCLSIFYSVTTGYMKKRTIVLLISFVVLLYMVPSSVYRIIVDSYSVNEVSNATRAEQFNYLVSEFSFWGNGLGSSLRSGYMRDSLGYGFELTYVNIVHKLGVFSIFLFLSYILTLTVASFRIVRRVYVFESFFVIGLMGYLVVGAGNPLLLSPCAVVLHCVAMYILAKPFLRPLKENHVVKAPQVFAA